MARRASRVYLWEDGLLSGVLNAGNTWLEGGPVQACRRKPTCGRVGPPPLMTSIERERERERERQYAVEKQDPVGAVPKWLGGGPPV